MATEAQLLEALRRADAAGDTPAAQAIARRLQETRTASYIRPEVDPTTEDMDPRDAQARRPMVDRPRTGALDRFASFLEMNPVSRFGRGVMQPMMGATQIAASPFTDKVNQFIAEDQRGYEGMRARDGQQGMDIAGTAGTIGGAVVPLARVAGPFNAAREGVRGFLNRAGNASILGGIGAAAQPVIVEPGGDGFAEQKVEQVGLGLGAGAVAGPLTEGFVRAAVPAINSAANLIRRAGSALRPQQYDNLLAQALQQNGIKWADMPKAMQDALRQDVVKALQTGGEVDGEAIRRLADIRSVGATPTRGTVSLDPVQITAEKNLAKVGANSTDPALQRLARVESDNNAALIGRINQLQGGSPADEFSSGALAIRALQNRDAQAEQTVRGLYDRARGLNGGDIPLDGAQFVNQASRSLDSELKGAFLPAEFRTILQRISAGEVPMNISTAEQLRTMLATAQRGAQDGNTRRALSLVRDALENTQPVQSASRAVGPAVAGGQGGTATADDVGQAFRRARSAHAARMKLREESPALEAALDGAEPDRFVRQFITGQGASVADVNALRRSLAGDPEALEAVRGQIVNHLKSQATGGAADEVATVSQKRLNDAINAIGDRKLNAFFSPEEVSQIRQVGRVASYLQVQPKGSAVNNSNTASAALGILDRIISRVPFGDAAIRTPMTNFTQQRAAQNALLQTLPVTGRDVIDDGARNALLRLTGPAGLAFGASAQ